MELVFQDTRWGILDHLMRRGPATLTDLADQLGCTRQNVHHHIKRLEAHGLAHVVDVEETNGLPRHYWATNLADRAGTDERVDPAQVGRWVIEGRL